MKLGEGLRYMTGSAGPSGEMQIASKMGRGSPSNSSMRSLQRMTASIAYIPRAIPLWLVWMNSR